MARPSRVRYPCGHMRFFVEHGTLEAKQLQSFLEKESASCEVVLASDPAQAGALAKRRRGKAAILVVHGGIADGRAERLIERLSAGGAQAFDCVAHVDLRHCRGALAEPSLESVADQLRASLSGGWLLVRFLEPVRR